MCLYPRLIKNKKYTATKKNGGNIPAVKDRRVLVVPVGCGKCMECKKQKSREWTVRLHEEIRESKNGKFVTMTFSDESIEELKKELKEEKGYELDNGIATLGVRRFLERWRKKYKKSVRHWLVTELGQTNTERIHIHGIIWTEEIDEISKIWKYGIVTIGKRKYDMGKALNNNSLGYVNEKTVNYIVKYINKTDEKHREYNSKILTSKGIGKGYTNRKDSANNAYKGKKTKDTYTTRQGIKLAMPTYYRNKIYSDEEREKLWIHKLDQGIRYINGIKVEEKDKGKYYRILKVQREKNKRLGYGDNEKNWEKLKYEEDRRRMLSVRKAIEITEEKEKVIIKPMTLEEAFE